jgi:beta-lactamase superfamily II metal-dependent hydrolase
VPRVRARRPRAKVRMYKVGFGDCFLITLPHRNGPNYYMMIDCGVILGTPNAVDRMSRIMANIAETTAGHVDLLAVTHEHWDHVSGFVQAAEAFGKLQVEQVWLAWTEDPDDDLAQRLARERADLVDGLRRGMSRLQAAGDEAAVAEVGALLGFFGASSGPSTRDALDSARRKVDKPRYCRPGDLPVQLKDPRVNVYTFGPPRDETKLKRVRDSTKNPETFGVALAAYREQLAPVLQAEAPESPFGTLYAIPMHVAQDMPFFKAQYWGRDRWRRIDTAWLGDTSQLALQLDNATNNTCLVLAVELGDGGDVLLFAGDAQLGNWQSWDELSWTVGQRTVTAQGLLGRTILYKVGHHGSSNATRRSNLDMMKGLKVAMVSVDTHIAELRNWLRLPSQDLIDQLDKQTNGGLVQADKVAPASLLTNHRVTETDLYCEVEL